MNDARDKLYWRHPWIKQYTGDMSMLSLIQLYDMDAYYLTVESLLMILNLYNDIRGVGNEAAHVASDAERSAAIILEVHDLPTWIHEHLINIYIYAYKRSPLQT
jgi:hypothetical protein